MNTRIDKLWGQALDQSVPETWAALDSAQLSKLKAKFAELIVRECARYFNEDYARDFDVLWREDLSKGMKQHFGVES